MKGVFMTNPGQIDRVYGGGRKAKVEERCEMFPEIVDQQRFDQVVEDLKDVEVIFSTWGMPKLSEEQIGKMPNLKAVFYGAGSVQGFARPFLSSGVKVFSAWAANAVPVAEFTLASILFGLKRVYPCLRDKAIEGGGKHPPRLLGVYDTTVGIISMGMIGRKVCELLRNFNVNVMAYDPFVPDNVFESLNVKRVELEKLFSSSDVVSLHAPNLESTRGMITGEHFRLMQEHTTFINTARGAVIRQDEMVEVLRQRSDLSVHLDVIRHGDPKEDLLDLPNVYFTPHIAGSQGNECWRMADYMIEEFDSWREGKPTRFEVSEAMLETMA